MPPEYYIMSLFVGLNGGLFSKTIRPRRFYWNGCGQTIGNDTTGGWLCGQPWWTTCQKDGLQAHWISYLLFYGRPYFSMVNNDRLTKWATLRHRGYINNLFLLLRDCIFYKPITYKSQSCNIKLMYCSPFVKPSLSWNHEYFGFMSKSRKEG